MKNNRFYVYNKVYPTLCCIAMLYLSACSSTRNIPEDDRLFVGLKKIEYRNYEKNRHAEQTQEEVEAALATAPNGALFGSSYYRTPFPVSLWIWNAFGKSRGMFAKWMTRSFGKPPVLMSWVNPALRASVAQSVLRNHGYFRGYVLYEEVPQQNPRKSKIGYTVDLGHLFTLDSIEYLNFPPVARHLLDSTSKEAIIKRGDAFEVASLDAERNRISTLFRNSGFYYYQPGYSSYLADTLMVPGRVQLRFQLAGGIPEIAKRKWYIGKIDLSLRKSFGEVLRDSTRRRDLTIHYNGRRPKVRARIFINNLKLHSGQLYSYDNYLQSANKLGSNSVFAMVDFQFTPRDSSQTCDTLDLALNCLLDKPYDFYVETNMKGKTSGYLGPELVVGFTKRNAFRGGEKLDINLKGSYDWQIGRRNDGAKSGLHSYSYGGDASLELPRLLLPFFHKRTFYTTPSTVLKASTEVINRAVYFKRHIVAGQLTYNFQPNPVSLHEVSPLILQYEFMTSRSAEYIRLEQNNPYLKVSMADQLIPKMRYAYTYTSPANYANPIRWEAMVSESANLLSLGYIISGRKWATKNKRLFKNPYAQFVKIETALRKTWRVGARSQMVAYADAGIAWSYGNSSAVPYSEQFYVGGANSIRAFSVRSIGPGRYHTDNSRMAYLDHTGDIKFQANIEYRPRLFGNLYGAIFLDTGNVWALRNDGYRTQSTFKAKRLLADMALGTGLGLRYDLDFFVLRIDWGVGLHVPYKSGFYNMPSFKDSHSLHLAIGYPF